MFMKKIIYIIILFLLVNTASAHNPQVSTISIIQNENNKWSVFVTAPLYSCQLAIHKNYPNLKIDSIDALQMQKLILDLVKNNLMINGDNKVKLIYEKIQLAHETTIYFEVNNTVQNFIPFAINFSAFSKLKNHFTLLKIVPNNDKQINYILNSDNQFSYPKKENEDISVSNFFNLNKYIEVISRIGVRYLLIAGVTFFIFYVF